MTRIDNILLVVSLSFLLLLSIIIVIDYRRSIKGQSTISSISLAFAQKYRDRPGVWLIIGAIIGWSLGIIVGFILGHLIWPQQLIN